MKKNKDNLVKDLKIYNLVMTNVWQLLTIIAIGILAGYLFEKYATNQDINYMAFSIIFFSIIGIINFFVSILKGVKKLEKTDKDKRLRTKKQLLMSKMMINNLTNEDLKILKLSFIVMFCLVIISLVFAFFIDFLAIYMGS